jgi:hypothetical protein
MSLGLRDELLGLKNKLEELESDLTKQMMDLEVRAEEWHKRDEEAENLSKAYKDKVITLNIGGKKFMTKLDTLLCYKDTLFSKLFLSKRLDITKEVFIDRPYYYFGYILSFLRNRKLNESLSNKQIEELLDDANFYEMKELIEILEEMRREIKYVRFEFNGPYMSGTQQAGTNNIEHLNNFEDRSMRNGICANYPGWIIIELTREVEFDEFEVGGWNGNNNIWASSNGSGSQVMVSVDKSNWNTIGTIPTNYGTAIQTVRTTSKAKGKFVKFQGTSYVGIGYFKIKKI